MINLPPDYGNPVPKICLFVTHGWVDIHLQIFIHWHPIDGGLTLAMENIRLCMYTDVTMYRSHCAERQWLNGVIEKLGLTFFIANFSTIHKPKPVDNPIQTNILKWKTQVSATFFWGANFSEDFGRPPTDRRWTDDDDDLTYVQVSFFDVGSAFVSEEITVAYTL